ncbi:MAG: SpoIIE family protein phosphatase [Candidatus Methylacidiphilales bacterium]
MEVGDRFFIYSDGVSEAANEAGDQYEKERIAATILSKQSLADQVHAVLESVRHSIPPRRHLASRPRHCIAVARKWCERYRAACNCWLRMSSNLLKSIKREGVAIMRGTIIQEENTSVFESPSVSAKASSHL